MGSSDSSCCGSHEGPPKPDIEDTGEAFKKQRSLKSYRDTEPLLDGEKKHNKDTAHIIQQPLCITNKDISQCLPLQRIIKVINKYNEWLHLKKLIDKKTLRAMDAQSTNYHLYDKDIIQLINSIDKYSIELFMNDTTHIKHEHHYQYKELRVLCIENSKTCSDGNCFSMKHYFLRNKEKEHHTLNPLEMLSNLHIYMFHSIYISQLKIQYVHPRYSYLMISYIEQIQHTLNIHIYTKTSNDDTMFPFKVIHLISFYFGAKFIQDNDILDKVSAIGLALFIEETMNKATLEEVWSKLDRDSSNTIDVKEVDDLLLVIALLVIATERQGNSGGKKHHIDKTELKQLMQPIGEWMKRDKMIKQPTITKKEFKKTFTEWLREYDTTNGGIVADQDMQRRVLNKYKIDDDGNKKNKEEEDGDDIDRLVVNCEYLTEHRPPLNPNAQSWSPSGH